MVAGLLLAAVLFVVYFLPYFAACKRKHRNREAILVLNLFLGWTFIGWVICAVWAFTSNRDVALASVDKG